MQDPNRSHAARRRFLKSAGYTGIGLWSGLALPSAFSAGKETITLPFGNGERVLEAFPGKRPLIVLTNRPPQLETPFSVFNDGLITPNDAFLCVITGAVFHQRST